MIQHQRDAVKRLAELIGRDRAVAILQAAAAELLTFRPGGVRLSRANVLKRARASVEHNSEPVPHAAMVALTEAIFPEMGPLMTGEIADLGFFDH